MAVTTASEKLGRLPPLGRLALAAVALVGAGLTLAGWLWIGHMVDQRIATELTAIVEQQSGQIERRFADGLLPVASLAVFLATHEAPEAAVFRLVAQAANRLGVPAARLGWDPLVPHADREAHEAAAQAEGLDGYRIVTFGNDGRFQPAPPRDEYFPMRFELLAPGFPSYQGFDISSRPDRESAVQLARQTRQATGAIPGNRQPSLRQKDLLVVYWPIFAAPGTPKASAPDGLRGYVTALMRLSDLLSHLVKGLPPVEGRLVLYAGRPDDMALDPIAHVLSGGGVVLGAADPPGPHAVRRSFPMLGMSWAVSYEPDPRSLGARRGRVALMVLGAGGGATLALVAVLYFLLRWVFLQRDLHALSQRMLEQQTARAKEVEALNAQLKVQEQRARHAAVARTRLLASASHDVRQPLQAMLVHAGIIEMGARDAPTRRAVTGLKNAVASLRGMFGVFLDLHRLDEGQVRVSPGYVDLRQLLQALCEEYALAAERKGIRLRLRAPACALWTDAAVLEVALRNLIGNAVKFTRSGGVLIAVRQRHEVAIEVWDTGPGIAVDARDLIFDEFTQLQAGQSGAGLGLSIARRMAALIGGRIALCSRVGKGSRFTLAIPRIDAEPTTHVDAESVGGT